MNNQKQRIDWFDPLQVDEAVTSLTRGDILDEFDLSDGDLELLDLIARLRPLLAP